MFQKKLNITPLGPGLPKIQVCAAIQKINSPAINVPLAVRAAWGPLFSRGLWLFAAQTHQHGGKVALGSVSPDLRAAKALFSLLCGLRSTRRTCHPAGRLQTNAFCSSLVVWEGRCPKKRQLHLPGLPAAPSTAMGRSKGEFPAMETAQPRPKHRALLLLPEGSRKVWELLWPEQ